MFNEIDITEYRQADYDIDPQFIHRWSPRAMNGEALEKETVHKLLEAGRWAPSSYNEQPWRFIVGLNGGETFEKLYDSLIDFNQMWCKNAGALVAIVSNKKHENGNEYWSSSFDCGSTWMSIALQASKDDLVCHGMTGINFDDLRDAFDIPDSQRIEMMFALGHPGDREDLPEEARVTPSGRKDVEELILTSD